MIQIRGGVDDMIIDDRFQSVLSGSIYALSMMVEYRDPYTSGHQQRVASLCCGIGKKMGLCQNKLIGLRVAGLLHDLGKIAISFEILAKPGKITKAERAVIQDHPKIGYEILRSIQFEWPVAQVALQHHERVDGSGYPNGMVGKKMLQESKIVGVADVVEAMMANRSYRTSRGQEAALEEITRNSGILYDSDVVDACLKVFDNGNIFAV